MIGVLGLVAPVFALIALGYGAATRKMVSDEGLKTLNDFAFYLCAPALLFAGASSAPVGGRAGAVFFGGVLVVYAVALLLGRKLLRRRWTESGVLALNSTFGNTFMLGLPIVLSAYGPGGVSVAVAIIGLHSLILLPITTVIMEMDLNRGASPVKVALATLRSVTAHPIVAAVLAGFAWHLLMPPLPVPVRRFLDLLGGGMVPILLFCLGASLRSFEIRREWADAALIGALKLFLQPALVWAASAAAGLSPLESAVAVTLAAMPTGANAFLMARRYAVGMERSGAAVLMTTVASVLTLSVVLAAFPGR
ncbi:AEC family transporter [Muricoccus radiodurans]|uniref:AEC family transporter n=1 Tax=Muricoccus radiodurans TaxID=2231721 RepID=UPI003CEB2EA8